MTDQIKSLERGIIGHFAFIAYLKRGDRDGHSGTR